MTVQLLKASPPICAVLVSGFLVAGCSWDFRKSMGLVGQGPDETRVVLNSPLQLPSHMPQSPEQLPIPQPGAQSLVVPRPMDDARQVLQGGLAQSAGVPSSTEAAFLAAAGANAADPEIRSKMAQDAAEAESKKLLLDGVFSRNDRTQGAMLDPAEEARRLSKLAKEQGKNPDLILLPQPTK
jgi:hypothetical protein